MSNGELEEIWARAKSATPGPWFVHYTDDEHAANARYISSEPGPAAHDERQGMAVGPDQANPNEVIAITLLQEPLFCRSKEFENNSIFIAAARSDIPKLVEEVRKLKEELRKLKIP